MFKLNIIGYFFSLLNAHEFYAQKKKYAKKIKSKNNQNAFKYGYKRVFRDVGVIGCTTKVIVPIKQL